MKGRQGLIFFSGSWEKFPGRNHRTGCPAFLLRASPEQVTNYQFRTTSNILAVRASICSLMGLIRASASCLVRTGFLRFGTGPAASGNVFAGPRPHAPAMQCASTSNRRTPPWRSAPLNAKKAWPAPAKRPAKRQGKCNVFGACYRAAYFTEQPYGGAASTGTASPFRAASRAIAT